MSILESSKTMKLKMNKSITTTNRRERFIIADSILPGNRHSLGQEGHFAIIRDRIARGATTLADLFLKKVEKEVHFFGMLLNQVLLLGAIGL